MERMVKEMNSNEHQGISRATKTWKARRAGFISAPFEREYIRESARTESLQYNSKLVSPSALGNLFRAIKGLSSRADNIKRALFYGKPLEPPPVFSSSSIEHIPELGGVVHGILGIFTEAGELIELLERTLSREAPLDTTNLIKELGDIYWYCAILHRYTDTSFEDTMALNLQKLKTRFPEKFTSENALKRDLEAERKILEEREPNENKKLEEKKEKIGKKE